MCGAAGILWVYSAVGKIDFNLTVPAVGNSSGHSHAGAAVVETIAEGIGLADPVKASI
jgi:hypothetical protein